MQCLTNISIVAFVLFFSKQMMNDHEEASPDSCIKKVGRFSLFLVFMNSFRISYESYYHDTRSQHRLALKEPQTNS